MQDKIIEIFGVLIMVFISFGVHELGHLITGLTQGFKFELFVIGPLGIKKENNRIKIYLNKNLQYYGGIAVTSPIDDSPDNENKFARLILAGPIASLVFAVICGAFFFIDKTIFQKIITFGVFISSGIFIATTLPSKTGVFFSDRKRYQRLMSGGKEKDVELAVLRVIGIQCRDDSYRNVNVLDIQTMIDDIEPFYKFTGLFTMLNYQFENHGQLDSKTKKEYDELSINMPKSFVKQLNAEIIKLK
ncbi:MAG: M50 family metallopeptidase [Anaerolineaceae bacterium]|nr:M50 family metallopeptidase [Anaerolineaceae bacterium]